MTALTAVVLAAGQGARATASGLVGPKSLLRVGKQAVLARLMTQLERTRVVDATVVAVRPEDRAALEDAIRDTSVLPATFVECSTVSSIETLQLALDRVDTASVAIVAADLVVRSEELIRFLVDAVALLAADLSLVGVQPIGAEVQSSRCQLGISPNGYLCCAGAAAGPVVASEGPRVFVSDWLKTTLALYGPPEPVGMWSLVEGVLEAGWPMRGLPMRRVMDIDDSEDLALAWRLVDDGTLDRDVGSIR